MKIEAYKVDCCNKIVEEKNTIGIMPVEDMFNRMDSYPVSTSPSRTNVHACMFCYRERVLDIAERLVDRKKNEDEYKAKIKELSYLFRSSVVKSLISKKKK